MFLKHMDNRHVLENDISVDARVRIAREVIGNILIHRDYTNAFPAKLIIEKDVLRTENWPFHTHRFRHRDDQLIASCCRNGSKSDSGVSGGRLDQGRAGF